MSSVLKRNGYLLGFIAVAAALAPSVVTNDALAQNATPGGDAGELASQSAGGGLAPLGTDGDWTLSGNTLSGSEYLGSNNDYPLSIVVDGIQVMKYNHVASSTYAQNILGGHSGNSITSGAIGAVIAGGGYASGVNKVTDKWGVVGGGYNNIAGSDNADVNDSVNAVVGGGYANRAGGLYGVVAGGRENQATGQYSATCGGYQNTASADDSTVGGGVGNTASNDSATVAGGWSNTASGDSSAVPGGAHNIARGDGSFAAGWGAEVQSGHAHAFVWSGGTAASSTLSAFSGSFTARAPGGFYLYSASSGILTGAYLAGGSGSWSSLSDRDSKENIVAVDALDVLNRIDHMPISTWSYRSEPGGVRHMGPMAQDFYAAFGLGPDDKGIVTVDGNGVALVAVQGAYRVAKAQQVRIENLEQDNEALRVRLNHTEKQQARIETLEQDNQALRARLDRLERAVSAARF